MNPTHVIHLAADVGGVYQNVNSGITIGVNNVNINANVMEAARMIDVQNYIACLSTCIFPPLDEVMDESHLHSGLVRTLRIFSYDCSHIYISVKKSIAASYELWICHGKENDGN